MLWVTITIVMRRLSCAISSSIRRVAIGSSAEQGSSISSTSGSTASERAMQRRCCWPPESPTPGDGEPVPDLLPEAGAAQRGLDAVGELPAARGGEPQAGGDVVEDRHRGEGVGLLEDHPDGAAHGDDVDGGVVDVELVEQHAPLGAGAGDLLVHAVDAAHHRGLAAAGGADDGGDLVGGEAQVDAPDLLGGAVEGAQPLQANLGRDLDDGYPARPPAAGAADSAADLAAEGPAAEEGGRASTAQAARAIGDRGDRQSASLGEGASGLMQGGSFGRPGGRGG